MAVILLSAAMMIAMLAATALGLHEEAQRKRAEIRVRSSQPFGLGRNGER